MIWKGERTIRSLRRQARRDELEQQLCASGPRIVYTGLLAHAVSKNFKKPTGWVAHSFREIYSDWPRQRDYGPPQANPLIEEWVTLRPKHKRK